MNKVLVILIFVLIPIAIETSSNSDSNINSGLESKEFTIDLFTTNDTNKDDAIQVSLSYNQDKTDAFTIDLEEYVIGVVAGEMPASFSMEALKAQAVASRTFALYKMNTVKDYVLSTTISDQVYLTMDKMQEKWGNDFEYYYDRVKTAVEETKGEVLTYDGNLASTYYFAISNGYTDDALVVFNEDKDYLVSVDSSWDKNYQSYSSVYTMNKIDFCNKLEISCDNITILDVIRADNNYVRNITINDKTFTGVQVFQKLNLKSTDFDIIVDGNSIKIQTRGFGHGIGMSQYGAQGMALDGNSYKNILFHYYNGTEIVKM